MNAADKMLDNDLSSPGHARVTRGMLQMLWRRKTLVLIAIVTGLVIAALVYTQQAAAYQSTAQLLVIKKRSENVLPVSGSNTGFSYVEDFVSTHVVVLRSPLIVERAVKKRDLGSLKSFEGGGDPIAIIGAGLLVGRDNNKDSSTGPSNIVNMSYRVLVSEDCPRILNAIIDSYQEFLDYNYTSSTAETLTLINKARDVLKIDKQEAEDKHRRFLKDSPLLWRTKEDLRIRY